MVDAHSDAAPATAAVRDNPARSRYELEAENTLAIADYHIASGVMTVLHTEVDPKLQGKGVGAALVKGVLDDIRARGLKVVPACSFVAAYIHRHPAYADLLAP